MLLCPLSLAALACVAHQAPVMVCNVSINLFSNFADWTFTDQYQSLTVYLPVVLVKRNTLVPSHFQYQSTTTCLWCW